MGERAGLLYVSVPSHYHVVTHVMTSNLCDIDQRPGMVAKMYCQCSAKHVNAVISRQSGPDTPFIDFQS